MSWDQLVNTRYFSEAAIDFRKNGGRYTLAPIGSRDYREYWELHERRCSEGYSVGGTWIPGRHYWFLNFTPIQKLDDGKVLAMMREARDKQGKISRKAMTKILDFPRFYEIGWEWNRYKHIAWNGGRFQHISSPGGEHIGCAKTRGAGFSYMEAADCCYNYNFIEGSKSYCFAASDQYLTKDGIMNKTKDMLDWINANIPYWSQNRMENDTTMHLKASYKDAFGQVRGSKSEIMAVIVDDPEKVRGKRGIKIIFEEGGAFKKLKKAYSISRGSTDDGSFAIGQILVFGTGGEEGESIEGLEDMFDNPRAYGMMAFKNIWEEGAQDSECGYFVPATKTDVLYMDEEGNVDLEGAMTAQEIAREIASTSKDPKNLDRRKAEYPIIPGEVFSRLAKNPFVKQIIDQQIRMIERSAAIQELIRYGCLIPTETGWEFQIMKKEDARPVDDYPHDQSQAGGSLDGCITVVERPYLDVHGHTPAGIYQMTFDPCYKDESEDLTSLWDATIWKNFNQFSSVNEWLPVAWLVGRPQDLTDIIRRMFELALWYNAPIQGEIGGGGQAVLDYAMATHQLHLLDYDVEFTDNREITTARNRRYLMNMPTEKKRMGLTYVINWHMEQRGLRENKSPIYNIQQCYKIRLLREMSKFDGKKNADSISNAIIAMFALKEKQYKTGQQEEADDKSNFYNRELFGDGTDGQYARNEEGIFVQQY